MANRKSEKSTAMVIEGSVTPAVGVLRRGRQALITRTDHIDDLERRGFIVFRPDLVEPEPEVVVPEEEAAESELDFILPDPEVDESVDDGVENVVDTEVVEPSGNDEA